MICRWQPRATFELARVRASYSYEDGWVAVVGAVPPPRMARAIKGIIAAISVASSETGIPIRFCSPAFH